MFSKPKKFQGIKVKGTRFTIPCDFRNFIYLKLMIQKFCIFLFIEVALTHNVTLVSAIFLYDGSN